MVGTIQNHALGAQMSASQGTGKRAEAIGHQAKAAVAAAREAGAEMPKNAQGLAASAVARGMDPASLFAARISEDAVSVPEGDFVPETSGGAVIDEADAVGVEGEVQADNGQTVVETDDGNAETAPEKPAAAPVVSEDPVLALFSDSSTEAPALE